MDTFCSNCGYSLTADVNFCPRCGKPTSLYYSGSGVSSIDPMSLASPLKNSSQIPSTEYGSNPYEVPLESQYELLNPYESQLRPPPPPPRRYFSIHMIAQIIGSILLLIIVSGAIYYIAVVLPNRPTPTLTPTPTSTPTHTTDVTVPLSDGRVQEWKSAPHAHWIQTRWWVDTTGQQWTSWVDSTYPPSAAGVIGLSGYIQDGITYYNVWLDDGSCWQSHKLSTNPNDGWTSFYRC